METPTTIRTLLSSCFLLAAIFACSNPVARFTKQYKCQVPGRPEPGTAYGYVERGMEHIRAEEFDCALGACSEAIRLDSTLATGYACRGGVLSNTGEYLRALKDFDKALSMQPDNGDFYYSRAVVHDRLGNTDSAFADLAKAVGLISSEFGRSVAFARRAEILHKQGKLDESIKDYSQAIRLAPNFAYHFGNRGDVYSEKKEYEKAIADYSEAIKLDPKNAYFRHDRAEAYRALGQVDLAVKDEAAVETAPGSPSPESDEAMKSERAPISGGDLTRQAISLPKPAYPPIARAARASGLVVVRVTVDESGRVVTATAVEGHPLLQAASVAAARQAKFEPRKLDGQPVKVSGMITFRFEAQ